MRRTPTVRIGVSLLVVCALAACGGDDHSGGSTTGGERNPTCEAGVPSGAVQEPVYAMHLSGQTSWYAAPVVQDLDGDGVRELIAAYYDVYVFGPDGGEPLDVLDDGDGRVYAPHVVADLDGDGTLEVFVQTFDHGMDVFTIPGSGENCSLWGTARGGPLRMGQPNGN